MKKIKIKYIFICLFAFYSNIYAHDLKKLPIGDGKLSTSPKVGYIWACNQNIGFGGGSHKKGDWFNKDNLTWDYTKKVKVEGQNNWQTILRSSEDNNYIYIESNNVPNHTTGNFPISYNSKAYEYDRNPNTINTQNVRIIIPNNPIEGQAKCVPNLIGIMTSGVILLNALDEPKRDAPAHEVQDGCDGHPQQSGMYHYHSISNCLKDYKDKNGHSPVLGYAIDGFGIYGKYSNNKKLTNEDLDECHGHNHNINWRGKEQEMYHYHGTDEYPYTIGCLKGNYDINTIRKNMRPNGNNQQSREGRFPPPGHPPRR